MARKTIFYDRHISCGGRMVDFFGWLLPLEYTGILKETKAARRGCAIFDVSHMGRLIIRGKDALSFLQKMTTNDVSRLEQGSVQYSLMLNEQGGVVDDLLVYNTGLEYRCVVNASNKEKVLSWFNEHKYNDMEIIDETDSTVLLSVQGPGSSGLMTGISKGIADSLEYMHVTESVCAGVPCIVSRSGYTGEDGFEISTANDNALSLWDAVMDAGSDYGLVPAGLGSRDILRIEAGYPLYGHEIDDLTNPLESSLGWVIKQNSKNFIGKDKVVSSLQKGIERRRIGFVMQDKGVPRQGYPVCNEQGREIGIVTSGTYSPNAEKFIGMALISKSGYDKGKSIFVRIRNRTCAAEIVNLPHVPYAHK